MPRGLSDIQIELTARELLGQQRRVTVRDVMLALQSRFGGCGRTERICRILKQVESQWKPVNPGAGTDEIQVLRDRLRVSEARAAVSEERERQHQDLWASRYAEKVAELEKHQIRAMARPAGVTHEQYLRVYQRAVDLARRLAKYEDPDKPVADERD